MKLGFVTAILPDLNLEQVLDFAAEAGYDCVEIMCWPEGKAERRYAGVTHINTAALTEAEAHNIKAQVAARGLEISGLGYYPNPLSPDKVESEVAVEQIRSVIKAAAMLDVPVVNTFIGRDWRKSLEENWPVFVRTWKPLIAYAQENSIKIGIENCPMFFSADEWPGGKNLMTSPAIWRRAFVDIPSDHFGLNFDPSHFIWQKMDYVKATEHFVHKFFHVHAKDATLDQDRLDEVGLLAYPSQYHTPKLPGLGDVDWKAFIASLRANGYKGAVCVEVEDRDYEGELEARKEALVKSHDYLRQFIPAE